MSFWKSAKTPGLRDRQLVFWLQVTPSLRNRQAVSSAFTPRHSSAWVNVVSSTLHLSFSSFAPNSFTTFSHKHTLTPSHNPLLQVHFYTLSQPFYCWRSEQAKTSYVLLPVRSIKNSDYGPPINRGLGLWSSHMKIFLRDTSKSIEIYVYN